MIASRRGLIVLSLIAALLAIAVALDRPGGAAPEDRRLVPGFEPARVTAIDAAGVSLAREPGGVWRVVSPGGGPADAAAIADLLGTVASARWERRMAIAPAPIETRSLAFSVDGGGRVVLHLGGEVAGADQTWARTGDGVPVLVPSWVATAIARDLAAVRRTQVVRARPDEITGLELHGAGVDLVVSGVPAVVHLAAGGAARLRPGALDPLAAALAALRVSSWPTTPAPPVRDDVSLSLRETLTIRVLGGAAPDELTLRGPCPEHPGEARVDGTAGDVCVPGAQLDAVIAAARAIVVPDAIDPAPVRRAAIARIEWRAPASADATVVDASGGGFTVRVAGDPAKRPADDDTVRAAIDALAAPASAIVPLAPAPDHGAPVVTVTHADGSTDALEQVAVPGGRGPALRRAGEPFALIVTPAALAAAHLGPDDLRDRALITEEPSALAALDVIAGARHAHAARGATIGEWTGDLDGAAVLAAAETIAHLRAARFAHEDELGATRLAITATFAAPPVAGGQPAAHAIELGAPIEHGKGGGCTARVDHVPVALDAARCATLAALAPR